MCYLYTSDESIRNLLKIKKQKFNILQIVTLLKIILLYYTPMPVLHVRQEN